MTIGDRPPNDAELAKLRDEVEALRAERDDARETLRAIRHGEVDGLVVETPDGPEVFTLQTADLPYREVVENINEGAVTVDSNGLVFYANDRFIDMVGADPGSAIGRSFADFLTEPGRAGLDAFLNGSMQAPRREEFELVVAGGPDLPVLISSHLLPETALAVVCLIVTDIGDRKRAEVDRGLALERADRQARKNEVLLVGARSVLEETDFSTAARRIFDACTEFLGARSGYLALLSEDGAENELLFLEAGGFPCDVDPELPMPIRGLPEKAYRTGRAVYDNDFMKSEWMQLIPGGLVDFENMLFAPLNLAGAAAGIIGIANKPGGFTDEDAATAEMFADLAAISLRNSRVREELFDSEKRFHHLFDNMAGGVAIYEPVDDGADFVFVDLNRAGQKVSEVSRDDVIGRRVTDVFPGVVESGLLDVFKRVFRKGEPEYHPLVEYKDERLSHWVENHVFRLPSGLIAALYEDTSARRRAEAALRESETRLRILVENIPDLIWLKDPDGIYLNCNPTFERFFGAKEAEIVGKTDYDFVDKDLADLFRVNDRRAMEVGGARVNEEWLTFADDGYRGLFETIKTPMHGADGALFGVLGIARDITDRVRVADARQRAADDLRHAAALTRVGHWHWDIATDEMRWSDEVYRMFDVDSNDETTHLDDGLFRVHPDDAAGLKSAVREALENQTEYRHQYRLRLPDGTERWCDALGSPVIGESGEVVALRGAIQDITERRQAETTLRESRAALEEAQRISRLGSWSYDVATDTATWSKEMFRLFRRAEEEGEPATWKDHRPYIHPDDWESLNGAVTAAAREAKPYDLEFRFVGGNDTSWARTIGIVVQDDAGKVVGLNGTVQDVTARKRADALFGARFELLEFARTHSQEETVRKVADQTAELTDSRIGFFHSIDRDRDLPTLEAWSTRPDGASRDAEDQGRHSEFDQGDLWAGVVEEKRAAIQNDYRAPSNKKGPPEGHADVVRELVVPVLRDDQVVAILGVRNKPTDYDDQDVETASYLADIAWENIERKRAETARTKTEDQLRQAQKMESIGRLAGGVAHDFNNILTVILNYTSLMRMKLNQGDPLLGDVEEIHLAGTRAADLTRQLLAFSRKQVIAPKIVDLNAVVARSEKMLRRILGENIDFVTILEDDLAKTEMDPGQLDQILINLAVNARDAIAGAGKLTIETSNVNLDNAYVHTHSYTEPGDYVMLAVSDSGCGMDRETQKQVFEPFFTTKGADKGTGLGLSTVYGIVKQGKGSVELYSEVGQGSTFKIYFPVADRSEPAERPPQPPASSRGSETILLIEDEEAVRKVARQILETKGYAVLEAAHPGEALVIARQHGKGIDLVLTDVVMPLMDGKECFRQLSEIIPGIEVLYMSGYTAETIAHQGVLDEGTNFIQKPFTIAALSQKVREVLDSALAESARHEGDF